MQVLILNRGYILSWTKLLAIVAHLVVWRIVYDAERSDGCWGHYRGWEHCRDM